MVATNSMATRSSLELMLDKMQQLEDHTGDIPPALPARPVSRARLPRARKPLKLDFQRRDSEQNDSNCKDSESKQTKNEDIGIVFFENSKQVAEKGISKIQNCYRGHQVRCYYKELRRGVIALQSFIRGENAQRDFEYRSRNHRAIIAIQNRTRKYLEHRVLQGQETGTQGCWDQSLSNDTKERTQVPYNVLIDLQKGVLRTEAKVRGKKEENIVLKIKLEELERKWQQYEERMKSMEKAWQDQFTYIQECLAASKKNPAPEIRVLPYDSTPRYYNQNSDTITIIPGSNPKGRSLDFPINSIYNQGDQRESANCEDTNLTEVGVEQVCLKLHPQIELRKLKLRFKAWKKEYKNKLRDAQSTFKKLGNSETAKIHKNWWGRLSS